MSDHRSSERVDADSSGNAGDPGQSGGAGNSGGPGRPGAAAMRKRRRPLENVIVALLRLCGMLSILTTAGIVVMLVTEAVPFWNQVSPIEFFFGTKWTPMVEPRHFGVLPLVVGSTAIALAATVIALPLGLGSATYLSEYARPWVRKTGKPVLEILAGIPTVVYGYFALTFVTPLLRKVVPSTEIFNGASAAIVVAVMILPTIASLSEDAMRAVPSALREAAYGLGATRSQVASRVVVRSALSGISASVILGLSRALGETMAVAIAAGSTPRMSLDLFKSMQTMTGFIVQVALGDVPAGSLEYQTIFAVGLTLFGMTLVMNLISNRIVRRYREVYA